MRIAVRPLSLVLGAAVVVLGGACSAAKPDSSAMRVVCVSKQLNEFLYAVGAQDVLVARDLTSIYPEAITKLPSVGYHRALSAEGIISMRPTLFLTDGNVGPDAVLSQVKKVGIPIEIMAPGESLDSAESLLTRVGARFHREARTDSVLTQWKAGMDSLWADTAQWASKGRPRVLIMHFGQIGNNYLAVNRGGPGDEMIHWAGGENAVDKVGGMTRLTPELIAKAAPDVIIATDVGFDRVGGAQAFAQLPGVSLTPAARNGRIYRLDETRIMYFGPRTPAAVRAIAAMIHP